MLAARHERKAIKHLLEDKKHRLRRNEETSKWREFFSGRKPATAPVGNDTARIMQLVSIGGGASNMTLAFGICIAWSALCR